MKKELTLILIITCSIILIGCSFNNTYVNDESDKVEAEQVVNQLYDCIEDKRYDDAELLFSQDFFKVTNKEALHDMFLKTKNKLGDYKYKKLIHWQTKRVTGDKPFAEYFLFYEVHYDKFVGKEGVQLLKKDGEDIKIFSYKINSEGFLVK